MAELSMQRWMESLKAFVPHAEYLAGPANLLVPSELGPSVA
jgi:hypothetical protein